MTAPSAGRRRRPPPRSPEGYTAAEWERDFRDDMKQNIEILTRAVQHLTLLTEQHGLRIEALEERPREQRAAMNTSSARDAARYAIGALVFAVISFALQHFSFH